MNIFCTKIYRILYSIFFGVGQGTLYDIDIKKKICKVKLLGRKLIFLYYCKQNNGYNVEKRKNRFVEKYQDLELGVEVGKGFYFIVIVELDNVILFDNYFRVKDSVKEKDKF